MMLRSSTIELNPKQAQAWRIILGQNQVEIKGWTTPERLHFIEQLILSALIHGEKCLMLFNEAELATTLRGKLEEHQVADFCALHQNATRLTKNLLRSINAQNSLKQKSPKKTKASDFELNLDKLERCRGRLNKMYQAVRKPVFGNLSWPALLGLYWSNEAQPGKALLNISMIQDAYDFNYKEYQQLLLLTQEAQSLYQLVRRLDHPLQQLHPQIFLKKDGKTAQSFCQEKLRAYQARFNTLSQKYKQRIEEYGRLLRQYFEQYTQEFLLETDQLLDQIKDNTSKYGAPFLNAKLGKIKWYGSLSAQGKSAIGSYKQLIQNYGSLKKKFEGLGWFSFAWPALEKIRSIAPVKLALESFENTLKNSHLELGQFVQEEQLRLNAKSVLPALVPKIQIAELEEEMDELLAELNTAELLSLRLDNKMLTLNKRKQYLDQVQQKLASLQQNMPDFAPFYDWQRFWLQRSVLEQNLLKALAENSQDPWPLSFQNWYMHQILLQTKSIEAPLSVPPLKEYHQLSSQFKAQLPEQINDLWLQRKLAVQKNFKGFKVQIENETEPLTQPELETYTELFPILCLGTEPEPGTIPQSTTAIFDWVLVWENQEDSQNDLKKYASLAKRVIVFRAPQKTDLNQGEETLAPAPEKAMDLFWSKFQEGIHPYFGMDRPKQAVVLDNGLTLPLALQKKQAMEQEIAFLGDGFLSQIDATDYAWEWQQQDQLRQKTWELIPVWSAACWQNLTGECRKIAAQIIGLEKQKNK
ncbi:hypothetical protein [Haliscomenobacter sp.]|uniref:hypothetical protein n=1 Tax=Haliscomenobacter sp. TaxID=2717303 RepID=UPI003BAC416E